MNRRLLFTIICFTILFIAFNIPASSDYPYDSPYYDDSNYNTQGSTSSDDAMLILIIMIIMIIVALIVWIVVSIWTYKDAEKRGENAILWALIVFLGGIVGLIVWFVVRPPIGSPKKPDPLFNFTSPQRTDRICPTCGRIIPLDAIICPYCRRKF